MSELSRLNQWIKKRPIWLQDAASRLIQKGQLDEEDYEELYQSCVHEAANKIGKTDYKINSLYSKQSSSGELKLKSIGSIEGINCLSPKKPLEIAGQNLAVIYGLNGSGKSGYIRILKHMCGAKSQGELHGNAYKTEKAQKKCSIEYHKDGLDHKHNWIAENGIINDLRLVDIFDAECGKVYISNENEVSYEPHILFFFQRLVSVCEKISSKIRDEEERKVSKKPISPPEYDNTEEIKWYSKLSNNTKIEEINEHCLWTNQNEQEFVQLAQRLSERKPAQKAQEIRKKNVHILSLIEGAEKYKNRFSNDICNQINALKEKLDQAKKTAEASAKLVFSSTPLGGIGSETWQKLWQYAKEYSQQEAYKNLEFPVTSNEALCVLCQQPLSNDAKSRMTSFEEFVKGSAQKGVQLANKSLQNALTPINETLLPSEGDLKTKIDAAGLKAEKDLLSLNRFYIALRKRKEQLIQRDIHTDFASVPPIKEWVSQVRLIINNEEQKAKNFDADAQKDNKDDLLNKQKALQARKWLDHQRDAIKDEVERLRYLNLLNSAKKLTDTTALSIKTGKLADELITQSFIARFNQELTNLGASHISVELFKLRTSKGKALHKLRLKGSSHDTVSDVLSEGENRIVALSAFLADVTGKDYSGPFVFDDPISSLDQNFEEAVVKRLVELSHDRQVIIFTHRLPMLQLIQDFANEENIEPITACVRKEVWGAGEPGAIPLHAKKPESSLNTLLNERIPQARNTLHGQGQEAYEPKAKSLCSDFRIIIENVVERELLADIIQRHRRAVNTKGKIDKLAKIQDKDCKYLDKLMTEYSRYEHSQPLEAPVSLPCPEKMEQDFKKLMDWINEFKKREIPSVSVSK
ncbi:MAG: hypothetical protein OXE97_05115 [Gammaproteobacteria bacterium]|nr:hypothetical protein [Gammaproteobacteria bacterium]MCY4304407.1 hypothetical protein [Aestuariivita sp.]